YRDEQLQMPPKGKLTDGQVADLTAWVRMGAPWPEEVKPGEVVKSGAFDLKERGRHWSLQPLQSPPLPAVRRTGWARSPVDRFLLARLEAAGLDPAGPA